MSVHFSPDELGRMRRYTTSTKTPMAVVIRELVMAHSAPSTSRGSNSGPDQIGRPNTCGNVACSAVVTVFLGAAG